MHVDASQSVTAAAAAAAASLQVGRPPAARPPIITGVSANVTVNRWRTVVSATWKYDDPRLNMSHEGAARVWHVQPRVVIFPFRTNYRVSYVLSSVQLQESWIICKLKGKIHCILYIFFCHVGETRVSGEIVCHLQMHAVVWCMLITVN